MCGIHTLEHAAYDGSRIKIHSILRRTQKLFGEPLNSKSLIKLNN